MVENFSMWNCSLAEPALSDFQAWFFHGLEMSTAMLGSKELVSYDADKAIVTDSLR